MAASIFIASMVATVPPAATWSPSATDSVTTPANGAATWPGLARSAFSVTGTSDAAAASRTWIGRNCPFRRRHHGAQYRLVGPPAER
ncbi:hypothetical protein SGLAM104S_05510 [Streptomyces glaucescens]